MNDTFMKERPVLPLLLSMALPNVVSMLVNSLYNIVDSLFVARISEDAMTALSLVFPIQNFSNAIAIGFGIGINAMIALYLGRGRPRKGRDSCHPRFCAQPCARRGDDGGQHRHHARLSAPLYAGRDADRRRHHLLYHRVPVFGREHGLAGL